MTFPSPPPSSFRFVRTALYFLWLLGGVHSQRNRTGFNIDTPDAIAECQATKLTWEGGQPPFTLNIHFYHNNSLFHGFSNLSGTALSWQATISAGNSLYLELFDSSNNTSLAFSGPFTIQSGNDACLQSLTASSGISTVATSSDYTSTGGYSSLSPSATSPTSSPSDAGLSGPSSKTSSHTLSTGAIVGVAVASLAAGILIALLLWLIWRRRKHPSRPLANQRQLDTYRYSGPPKSDDGWSVTTPRDPEDELHSQPGEAKTGLSWDPHLFAREGAPSPSPPAEHPVATRQVIHPGIARPLSSYPPLIPIPSPDPMSSRESGMWVDAGSGASLSRSSTNPFRARMLAAAASSGTVQTGVNGSNW
ncbi:hypothetical protein V8D89_000976 [Ganoderma adspersum]